MKIGILTFHWATNYGAVLQCYALQQYLENLGHEVIVINYTPSTNDDSFYNFIRYRKFLSIKKYCDNKKKESELVEFRRTHLNLSKRYYTYKELSNFTIKFDAIISGSDQVLNPSFLMNGEGRGCISPTYFLGFQFAGKKIGYALSFGCVSYPAKELCIASKYIDSFDRISVRETTGINIISEMGREDSILVPDPTLLMSSEFYEQLAEKSPLQLEKPYVYSFFIRNKLERKSSVNSVFSVENVLWDNEDGDYSMQGWIYKIRNAKFVVTDSFHCMVMCLKLHTPFAIVTEHKGNVGMNDRFYTLLDKMNLLSAIVHKDELMRLLCNLQIKIEWDLIDSILKDYMKSGALFLSQSLK